MEEEFSRWPSSSKDLSKSMNNSPTDGNRNEFEDESFSRFLLKIPTRENSHGKQNEIFTLKVFDGNWKRFANFPPFQWKGNQRKKEERH